MKKKVADISKDKLSEQSYDQLWLNEDPGVAKSIGDDTHVYTEKTVDQSNPFLIFLGIAPLPDGMDTNDLMKDIRGEPDVFLQNGPGTQVISLDDYIKQRP